MSLTEVQIRSAKTTEKPITLFESGGLYLLVNASCWWWLKSYFVAGLPSCAFIVPK